MSRLWREDPADFLLARPPRMSYLGHGNNEKLLVEDDQVDNGLLKGTDQEAAQQERLLYDRMREVRERKNVPPSLGNSSKE
jgi:hypothetical protein